MTKNLSRRTGQDIIDGSMDPVTPIASQSLFWHARYLAASPTLGALPLLFWLTENARPAIAVTLGIADAVPHFALCQAVEKLGLTALCLGMSAYGDTKHEIADIQAYNDTHYGDFSMLSQADNGQAAEILDDTEVDFLIVNIPATPALQDEIDSFWLPRMSDRAVILFLRGGENLREYATRIAGNDGQFNFDTEKGIHLVLRGARQNDRLARLCQLRIGKPGYLAVRNVFARVGELHSKTHEAEPRAPAGPDAAAHLGDLEAKLSDRDDACRRLSRQLEDARAEVDTLREAHGTMDAATLQNDAPDDAADLRLRLSKSEQELENRFQDIAVLGSELKKLTTELEDTRNRAAKHMRTLESTTRDTSQTIASHKSELDGSAHDLALLRDVLSEVERERDEALQRVSDLESSSSWRITSPLRRASMMVRPRGGPK